MSDIITRFAPSPTGNLHLGGARVALFNFLLAKKERGTFFLRIDDTDLARSKEIYLQNILTTLNWLSLDYKFVIFQKDRHSIYHSYLANLIKIGAAYVCNCNNLLDVSKLHACRDMCLPLRKDSTVFLKSPTSDSFIWEDKLRGKITLHSDSINDFVLLRKNGFFTYNFCCAVDDITLNVTHILRGDDHLSNTAKQAHLYRLLGVKEPVYIHLPLIYDEDGSKLSKRSSAFAVTDLQRQGVLATAVINYLARLGWSYGNKELFTLDELEQYFDVSHLSKSPARFNYDRLLWINFKHLNGLDNVVLLNMMQQFSSQNSNIIDMFLNHPDTSDIINCIKQRGKTILELIYLVDFLSSNFQVSTLNINFSHALLEKTISYLEDLDVSAWHDEKYLFLVIKNLAIQMQLEISNLTYVLRLILTNKDLPIPIGCILKWLGKQITITRIRNFIDAQ